MTRPRKTGAKSGFEGSVVELALNGKTHKSSEEIREFIIQFFESKSSGFFVKGFTDLPNRW